MEALLPPAQLDGLHAADFVSKPFGFAHGRVSSQPNLLADGGDLLCGGYSTHPSGGGSARSASLSPRARSSPVTGSVVDEEDDSPAAAAEHRARLARLSLRYQEEANRYRLCFSHLADTSDEVATLRRENDQLRFDNGELVRRIAVVGGNHSSAIALADEFRRLTLAEEQAKAMPPPPPPPPPEAVMRPIPATMPKSISVRSTGYLKMNSSRGPETNNAGSQRVFVGLDGGAVKGEEKKEQGAGGVEFEVYNQGMFKTELCNKWEETGSCMYGDHCQFAHGIAELRPVIRHPRYKTEVCRMVLAGILCPYGHRCHFRHSITPADSNLLRC